jgi:hypothetical protein
VEKSAAVIAVAVAVAAAFALEIAQGFSPATNCCHLSGL